MITAVSALSLAYAQDKFVEGKMKIGKDTYEVAFYRTYSSVGIVNISKNIQEFPQLDSEVYNRTLPIRDEDKHFDVEKEKAIVVEALGDKIKQVKANKKSMHISYIFYPDGKIMNIDFILLDRTVITPNEIARIDQNLRNKLRMTFTGEEYKAFPSIPFDKQRIYF